MYKIAVLGDRESVLGFLALGFSVFPAEGSEEARKTLRRLAKEDYAVIYVTEALLEQLGDEADRCQEGLTPAVIPIPGAEGSLGLGLRNLRRSVERAVGADILFGND